jgi:hypothetical protein
VQAAQPFQTWLVWRLLLPGVPANNGYRCVIALPPEQDCGSN